LDFVERSNTTMADGRSCGTAPSPPLPAARLVSARNVTPSDGGRTRQLEVELATTTCCGPRALRAASAAEAAKARAATKAGDSHTPSNKAEDDAAVQSNANSLATDGAEEFNQLLRTLVGRCMRVLSGWWTYEICWPWRVRQMHLSIDGQPEYAATVLGNFTEGGVGGEPRLLWRRAEEPDNAASRADGSRHELAVSLSGDACEKTVHTWELRLVKLGPNGPTTDGWLLGVVAVGGSFNPTGGGQTQGVLTLIEDNRHGCEPFKQPLQNRVMLLKRGNCWFHTKALNAQAAGAAAIIVYNDQRSMVDVMEGVDELESPRIPTVLVDRDIGDKLRHAVGYLVLLAKSSTDSMDLKRPISTSVSFRCSPAWLERREACQSGDQVDVKMLAPNSSIAESHRKLLSAVLVLKAAIVEVFRHNATVLVSWQPQGLGEQDTSAKLSPYVPANATYRGGLRCDSDPGAYIENLAEPQACQAEFVVHAAALCAHPRLAPPQPRETQVITCLAKDPAQVAARRRVHEKE